MTVPTPEQLRQIADGAKQWGAVDLSMKWYEAAREEHAEVDRLRAVIETAPHAWDCTDPDGGSFCTCWKAGAL